MSDGDIKAGRAETFTIDAVRYTSGRPEYYQVTKAELELLTSASSSARIHCVFTSMAFGGAVSLIVCLATANIAEGKLHTGLLLAAIVCCAAFIYCGVRWGFDERSARKRRQAILNRQDVTAASEVRPETETGQPRTSRGSSSATSRKTTHVPGVLKADLSPEIARALAAAKKRLEDQKKS